MSIVDSSTILVDGMPVTFPVVKSYSPSGYPVFQKSDWTPDADALCCRKCQEKFTHFKRKHHCRCCGQIFCSKCCSEKIPLPHFGMTDPEKVCSNCSEISLCIVNCISHDQERQHNGIIGLSSLISSSELCKVIECGGLHIVTSIAERCDVGAMGTIASTLHIVAQQTNLNSFLVEIGTLKILRSMLALGFENHHLLDDSLVALCLLSRDVQIRNQAIKERLTEPLLSVLAIPGMHFAALASRVLLLFLQNFDTHEFILQTHPNLVPTLFKALQVDDFQMQSTITKMLVYLSAGNESTRCSILVEDEVNGFPLTYLLKSSPSDVVLNTVCVVSNLATVPGVGTVYITACGELLTALTSESVELITQVGRGLANFAETSTNALYVLPYVSSVISLLMKSRHEAHKYHACRFLLCMMLYEPSGVNEALVSDGLEDLLMTIFQLPGVPSFLTSSLLKKVSRLSVCSS